MLQVGELHLLLDCGWDECLSEELIQPLKEFVPLPPFPPRSLLSPPPAVRLSRPHPAAEADLPRRTHVNLSRTSPRSL